MKEAERDEFRELIREVMEEDRNRLKTNWVDSIKPFINVGLIVVVIGLAMMITTDKLLSTRDIPITPGESTILIFLTGMFLVMGIVVWDITSGINILERDVNNIKRNINVTEKRKP